VRAAPLEFAEGIRPARPDECPPDHQDAIDAARRAAATVFVPGFTVRRPSEPGATYVADFQINVHASELMDLFGELARAIIGEIAAPIVGLKDEPPEFGAYTDRDAALEAFAPHHRSLTHDGFLGFGIIFQVTDRTNEVFVHPSKWLQVWTTDPDAVRAVLERRGIREVADLAFVDQFPLISSSLPSPSGNATWPACLEALRAAFAALPPR
jgi:hypothetical protein